MLFNSLAFGVFFLVVTVVYFLLPHRFRWMHLLAASCFFYMFFKPEYILILGFTIIIDYYAGILLEQTEDKRRKKWYLIMSIIANVGVLALFKYYNFFNYNLSALANHFGFTNHLPVLRILLPLGLSFHTFQAMSYTIEVYRGNQKAERHFGIYSLYVMFYPQLVAGPIERPQNMLHQFYARHSFNYRNIVTGLRLILWGIFKKVVVADSLAHYVDPVFDHPSRHTSIETWIAVIFFSYQLYCDFSAYSDIAVGSARVMGFKLMRNFDRPYSARSILEFWRRWHMSFSSWVRDYLYIPLGGNRVSRPRFYLNMFIVFLIVGLWHGASWTFIIYGLVNGFYVVFGSLTASLRNKLMHLSGISRVHWLDTAIRVITTFLLVAVARVLFRSEVLIQARMLYRHLWNFGADARHILAGKPLGPYITEFTGPEIIGCMLLIVFIELVQAVYSFTSLDKLLYSMPRALRWGIYVLLIMAILVFRYSDSKQFIYFQF